ncbi:MAG: PHP domain-containing protein [Bacillota bacterium]|nr:PHP domain-containing protein [Bacillota bacterium]
MALYRFDTHVHTSETSICGKIPGAEVARLYKQAGYSGIVITDHFHLDFFARFPDLSWPEKIARYLAGYRAALQEGRKIGLTVLLGMELRFPDSENDYLVYGFDEAFLLEHEDLCQLGLENFHRLTRGRDILIFQAHPFRDGQSRANQKLLDGVEVFNGHPRQISRNRLAEAFASENRLLRIAGSDAHFPAGIGTSGILTPEPITSIGEFVKLWAQSGPELIVD